MAKYGPVPVEKRETFQRILSHAFAVSSGRDTDEDASANGEQEWSPTLFEPRGVFEDGELVSVCKQYHLDTRLHGEYVTVGGVGAVATPPEHRRDGHVRTLAAGMLAEYHDDGCPIALLWPFSTPFYRNIGWGVANKYTEYELPPGQLAFARGEDGQPRRLGPSDWERLRDVEVAATAETNLSLRRSKAWWHNRTLAAWNTDTPPYIYGYEQDGTLQGYVLYTVRETGDGKQLRVTDLLACNDEAYRGLLSFLSDHDSQVDSLLFRRTPETELLDMVPDPDQVECRVRTGPMVRLTGVIDPLESYPWPAETDVTFTLAVSDPLLDRTDGTFEVAVSDGVPEVRETADTGQADLQTNIRTLSQLFVGAYSLPAAQDLGRLSVANDEVVDPLGSAFDGASVCLREFF